MFVKPHQIRRSIRRLISVWFSESTSEGLAKFYGRSAVRGRLHLNADLRRSAGELRRYENAHRGETGIIIGNGPSLNDTQVEMLRSYPTFGLNRIYLKFEDMGFDTTYHVCVNKLVMEQCASEISKLPMPLFSDIACRQHIPPVDRRKFSFLASTPGPFFATDPSRTGVWQGATVTYVAMQLAYYMGFDRIILVGVDHHFTRSGPPHTVVTSTEGDRNHFDPNYFGKGFRWQLPDLETSEVAYALARDAFGRKGREIVDCTVGGRLRVFRRSTLERELP